MKLVFHQREEILFESELERVPSPGDEVWFVIAGSAWGGHCRLARGFVSHRVPTIFDFTSDAVLIPVECSPRQS